MTDAISHKTMNMTQYTKQFKDLMQRVNPKIFFNDCSL